MADVELRKLEMQKEQELKERGLQEKQRDQHEKEKKRITFRKTKIGSQIRAEVGIGREIRIKSFWDQLKY